jgi:hypothetical protein
MASIRPACGGGEPAQNPIISTPERLDLVPADFNR